LVKAEKLIKELQAGADLLSSLNSTLMIPARKNRAAIWATSAKAQWCNPSLNG
jgi:hypothetical protein